MIFPYNNEDLNAIENLKIYNEKGKRTVNKLFISKINLPRKGNFSPR